MAEREILPSRMARSICMASTRFTATAVTSSRSSSSRSNRSKVCLTECQSQSMMQAISTPARWLLPRSSKRVQTARKPLSRLLPGSTTLLPLYSCVSQAGGRPSRAHLARRALRASLRSVRSCGSHVGAGTKPPEDAVDYLAVITPGAALAWACWAGAAPARATAIQSGRCAASPFRFASAMTAAGPSADRQVP